LKNRKTDAHAEHAGKELVRMATGQGAHQFLTRTLSVSIKAGTVAKGIQYFQ
jgi:hypothetical protein